MARVEVIDYADNVIKIKRYIRAVEEALLRNDFDFAVEAAVMLTVESRLLSQNVKLLNDNDGVPYQVELQRTQDVRELP
jgi:hypothetical protein